MIPRKAFLIVLIFLLSVPLVFAAELGDIINGEEKYPTVVKVYEGSTAITDSLSSKADAEKPALLATATANTLKEVKYPYEVSGTEITILKYKCNAEICGYWISATRGGKEVYTNSPIWISPPPYEVVISDVYYSDEKMEIPTADSKEALYEKVTLKEDPKLAVELILQQYVDMQPLGKAVSYER